MKYIPRLKRKYKEQIVAELKSNYKSVMQVPRLLKICLNQGVNSVTDKKQIQSAQNEMTIITGQKAVLTKSKKDISNFKLRKGMPVGVMVTLRGDKMYEFLDRLVTSTLPRVRDFGGISIKGFDGRGNYTLGIKEQIAFPEISIDKVNKVTGMDITFVTNTNSCILFYNMIDYNYKDLQVASLQIYESLKWALKNNLRYFDIGVSQLYEKNKIIPHESLIHFKEQFGSKAMIRKVMSIKI